MRRFLLASCLAIPVSLAQATNYQFTGPTYSTITNYTPPCGQGFCGTVVATDRVSGYFTTAAPLAANLAGADISGLVTDYFFSNGYNGVAPSYPGARIYAFQVWTDAAGQITDTLIHIQNWTDANAADPHGPNARYDTFAPILNGVLKSSTLINAACNVVGTSPAGTPDSCMNFLQDGDTTYAEAVPGGSWAVVPTLTINSVSVVEGNAGVTNLNFTVSLSQAPTAPVSLGWYTSFVSATEGSDYLAGAGTLNWAAGDGADKTITVQVVGDTAFEPDETFTIQMHGIVGALALGSPGTGTILNDDAPPPEVPPVMGDVPDQNGTDGVAFSLDLSGHVTPTNGDPITGYAIASGSLPPGLALNAATGMVSGTPSAPGAYDITVTASDNDGASNADAIRFAVAAAPAVAAIPTLSDVGMGLLVGVLGFSAWGGLRRATPGRLS